jgi:phosphohistidine phosphatase
MKKLIFVRHGRAEESSSMIPDYERSLTTKGKNVSEQMALVLKKKDDIQAVFVTSPAFRAYETAIIFARVLEYDPDKIILKDSLYSHATLKSFAEILEEITDEINAVIFFGHNPSFTEIPDRLSKNGIDFMPKTGIACISFKTETWKGIVSEKGKVEYLLKPEKTI